ncbi:MAG: Na+/H+ antiporter subunit E [Chloroflexota bacterium]
MRYLRSIIPLLVLYIALTGNVEPGNWVIGILIAVGITALLRPNLEPIRWSNLPLATVAAFQFVFTSLKDLFLSSIQLAWILVQPTIKINQGIFPLAAETKSKNAAILSAHAITLTPGEMVIEIDDEAGILRTHAIDVEHAVQHEPEAQRKRAASLEKFV